MKRALLLLAGLLPASCEIATGSLNEVVNDAIEQCATACTHIEECSATPPVPQFGNLGTATTGEEGLDCAVGCVAEDRELRGYSDCQIECIVDAACGKIEDCWDPKSDRYATFCLDGRDVPEVDVPAEQADPSNGSVSGSDEADHIFEDPAVAIAVEDAGGGFVVNFGDEPPRLVGKYDVDGRIDESSNARAVGSRIDTSICFWDYTETDGGVVVTYCEDGVPGEDSAPLTGTNDAFTVYFEYPGQATVLFSGSIREDGTLSQVEALVVYTYTTDVWELSHTDWVPAGDCDSCF